MRYYNMLYYIYIYVYIYICVKDNKNLIYYIYN